MSYLLPQPGSEDQENARSHSAALRRQVEDLAALSALPGSDSEPSEHPSLDNLLEIALTRLQQVDLDDLGQRAEFQRRLDRHLEPLIRSLSQLYGAHVAPDELGRVIGDLGSLLANSWLARSDYLRGMDSDREHLAPWWNSRHAVVAACYADRWAGGFQGIRERIPYLKDLGVTHLRLLPPFLASESFDDGGFSVASYRSSNPRMGTITELADLGEYLQENGISLMLDVVLSRTAPDHPWANAAARHNSFFEEFYRIQPDGPTGDASQRSVWAQGPAWERVVPTDPGDRRRVRTSEHAHQWDLDWTNPRVFLAMAGEMLHVAGLGAQVLRVGSPWHLWGAVPGNPDVLGSGRQVLRALANVLQIVAPSVVLESNDPAELRVAGGGIHVAEGLDRAALIWSSIATRDASLLTQEIRSHGGPVAGKGYLQPVRNHDALQWSFSDDVVIAAGLNPDAHRRFLGEFYSGRYEGSFAANPAVPSRSGRIGAAVCGTAASLAGVRHEAGPGADRVLLAHAVAFSLGGVPELWLGDELGVLDDPLWSLEPGHETDPRWSHRPRVEASVIDSRHDLFSVSGRLYGSIRRMLQIRAGAPEFDGQTVIDFDTRNEPVLGYQRPGSDGSVVLCLANFSDWGQYVTGETLSGFQSRATLLQEDTTVDLRNGVLLEAHGWVWIRCIPRRAQRS
ncbi:alpha-amylase family glycosyl hydrolase [Kocuria sp.]|uniref:alpha-amylase family glycosyl hydrolase n=1 Tax=Kocuria sp. TaxID=1871328 RepID=UPI0026E0305C|nr:alpha-amylase family glycosyl hydrolase [Kocuria sp.]MDO5619043.1 alpha-amylase family glycosyl hydrolase [Kocuria sp.]